MVTKRRLLEWETAAATAAKAAGVVGQRARRFASEMAASPIIAIAVTLAINARGNRWHFRPRRRLSSLWIIAPVVGLLAQRPGGRTRSAAERSRSHRCCDARRARRGATSTRSSVNADAWLVPDNLSGRRHAKAGAPHVTDQRRHEPAVDAGRA
jgi:hypothetical protein